MEKDPSKAFVSLDVANAFGAVQWMDALEAVLDRAPSLAPALSAQWSPRAITLFTQQRDGTWQPIVVYGGLFQGGCNGHPCFCIVLGVIWAHVTDGGVKFYINQVLVWFLCGRHSGPAPP